jgi:iron complex outermembrane receptor protein
VTLTLGASYNNSELEGSLNPALDGKKLVETPEWTYNARMDVEVTENIRAGLQAKQVGDRYSTDLNDEVAPRYTVVDVDLNWGFNVPGFDRAEVQLNCTNLLDEEYFGNISSGTGGTSVGFFSIGAPRTFVASVRFNF